MNRETMTNDLNDLLEAAKSYEASIELMKQNLATEKEKLRATVTQHQVMRMKFIETELGERRLSWCTSCKQVSATDQFEFIFIEGKKEVTSGYENSCYGYEYFSKIHFACQTCRNDFLDRHGFCGREGTFFHAFVVEKRELGYYAKKFGNWTKLEEEKCALSPIPHGVAESMVAGTCVLPPIMVIDYREGRENLIIRPAGIVLPA